MTYRDDTRGSIAAEQLALLVVVAVAGMAGFALLGAGFRQAVEGDADGANVAGGGPSISVSAQAGLVDAARVAKELAESAPELTAHAKTLLHDAPAIEQGSKMPVAAMAGELDDFGDLAASMDDIFIDVMREAQASGDETMLARGREFFDLPDPAAVARRHGEWPALEDLIGNPRDRAAVLDEIVDNTHQNDGYDWLRHEDSGDENLWDLLDEIDWSLIEDLKRAHLEVVHADLSSFPPLADRPVIRIGDDVVLLNSSEVLGQSSEAMLRRLEDAISADDVETIRADYLADGREVPPALASFEALRAELARRLPRDAGDQGFHEWASKSGEAHPAELEVLESGEGWQRVMPEYLAERGYREHADLLRAGMSKFAIDLVDMKGFITDEPMNEFDALQFPRAVFDWDARRLYLDQKAPDGAKAELIARAVDHFAVR